MSRKEHKELDTQRHRLEGLVAERTAELERANRQLQISDLRLEAMFDILGGAHRRDDRTLPQGRDGALLDAR